MKRPTAGKSNEKIRNNSEKSETILVQEAIM